MSKRDFFKNRDMQMSKTYLNNDNIKSDDMRLAVLSEDEKINFTINGEELNPVAQIKREIIKIKGAMLINGEGFNVEKYNSFRQVIDYLDGWDDWASYNSDSDDNDFKSLEAIKDIIVDLDLELGVDVQFVKSFSNMVKSDMLNRSYEMYQGDFNFDNLYGYYYNTEKKK